MARAVVGLNRARQVLLSAEGKDYEIAEGSRREGDTGVGVLIAPVSRWHPAPLERRRKPGRALPLGSTALTAGGEGVSRRVLAKGHAHTITRIQMSVISEPRRTYKAISIRVRVDKILPFLNCVARLDVITRNTRNCSTLVVDDLRNDLRQ